MDDAKEMNDVRRMVLAQGALLARRCADAVEKSGLAFGTLEDEVRVGGVQWKLFTSYFRSTGFVRLNGNPVVDEQHGMHPFMQVFVETPQDDGSFQINLPSDWLPSIDHPGSILEMTDEAVRG